MFYEWVAKGAEIGITAFFAVVVFVLFVAAIVGLLGLGAKIINDEDRGPER